MFYALRKVTEPHAYDLGSNAVIYKYKITGISNIFFFLVLLGK